MSDLHTEIHRLVDRFVAEITELANQAAVEGLRRAVGRGGKSYDRASRARGQKRSPHELTRMQEDLAAFVAKNPGLRIEQINKQLGTQTKDLALPIRKLIADGVLKSKGKKRSTTYYPGARAKN